MAKQFVPNQPAAPSQDPPAAASPKARFRVTAVIPTPLAHPSLDVDATDDEDALEQFYAANGITGLANPADIQRLS